MHLILCSTQHIVWPSQRSKDSAFSAALYSTPACLLLGASRATLPHWDASVKVLMLIQNIMITALGVFVVIAASALGNTAAASQSTAGQAPTSHCASPGYVFIPCQQPSNDKQEIEVYGVDGANNLQEFCDYYSTCAVYTTEGVFYSVSADKVKVGPFKTMSSCHDGQPTQSRDSAAKDASHCKGTYVFDGQMVRKKQGPRRAGPRANKASLTPSALTQQYVRQAASGGGVGKVGREQCMLC